jgi:protein-S-isoprenylcysteine O-methyltransferase Ste14
MADGRPAAGARYMVVATLARFRVALGFVFGVLVLILARPNKESLTLGMSIAACGEAIRVWAAGHLRKSREVTVSGPYRWVAHPLYVGSAVMGAGLAVASASVLVGALITIYLVATLTAAIKNEEAFLRRTFGDQYDLYRSGVEAKRRERSAASQRRFSLKQAVANREYRAIAGLGVAILLLIWKATYNGLFWRAAGAR